MAPAARLAVGGTTGLDVGATIDRAGAGLAGAGLADTDEAGARVADADGAAEGLAAADRAPTVAICAGLTATAAGVPVTAGVPTPERVAAPARPGATTRLAAPAGFARPGLAPATAGTGLAVGAIADRAAARASRCRGMRSGSSARPTTVTPINSPSVGPGAQILVNSSIVASRPASEMLKPTPTTSSKSGSRSLSPPTSANPGQASTKMATSGAACVAKPPMYATAVATVMAVTTTPRTRAAVQPSAGPSGDAVIAGSRAATRADRRAARRAHPPPR